MNNTINLRQFRKRKKQAEKSRLAEENRKLHGLSSKLKRSVKEANAADAQILDGKRREPKNHDT